MMFAKNLKPGQTVKVTPEDGGEILHISQVCMSKPVDNNRTYLKIIQGSQSFSACVLQKDKQECCSVDLFLSAREGIQLSIEGGKNELSLIGYFEPEPESDSEGEEDDMQGFAEDSEEESEDISEDETDNMTAPVIRDGRVEDLDAEEEDSKKKGKATTNNNKKAQALKALQAAASNEEDEDEDEDDDDEGEEDEDDEDDDDDEDGDEDEEEDEDNEDGSEEEEEEEEETAAAAAAAAAQDKKRKGQQQPQKQQQQQQANKKAKTGAAAAGGGGGDDESVYRSALIEYLKKNGTTPLASLGQKVKKPNSIPKMASFLKQNANIFAVEGGKCSLK